MLNQPASDCETLNQPGSDLDTRNQSRTGPAQLRLADPVVDHPYSGP